MVKHNDQTAAGKPDDTADTTHFGFRDVKRAEKAGLVRGVFDTVARRYDVMNDVMSLGMHRLWKDSFIEQLSPRPGMRLLDVAGGTGDIAFRFLDKANRHAGANDPAEAIICDINANMLGVGRMRAGDKPPFIRDQIEWVCGDAERLPVEDKHVHAYTIAFGIRNVTNIQKVLGEACRVLRPGGRFMCLEFSHVALPALDRIYDSYSFNVIPKMGELIAKDRASYQYLVESIRKFPPQKKFSTMIEAAGFSNVSYRNMTGGVVAVHSGWRI